MTDLSSLDNVHRVDYHFALCCEMCLFSMREAEKEFLEVRFQACEVVLDGLQPQTLKSDIELTTMSYQLVI